MDFPDLAFEIEDIFSEYNDYHRWDGPNPGALLLVD